MHEEKRHTSRCPFSAPAEVLAEETGSKIGARVRELSLYGCYLDTPTPLTEKTAILLKIFGPQGYFEAAGTVIYSNPTSGMGIVFRTIKPGCQAVLQKWLLQAMTEIKSVASPKH